MQETLDRFLHLLRDCWRYRWWGLLTAWVVAIIGWCVVAVIPNRYEATAEVYVDTESVLQPLLKGIAVDSMDVGEKLALVATELLSRPVLEQVILQLGMDTQATSPEEHAELVRSLEQSISLDATRTHGTSRSEQPNLYVLSVRGEDAMQAYKVVEALLNIFMEDAIGSARQNAGEATEFLEEQVRERKAELDLMDQRIARFRQENIGRLPEQGQTAYERLQAAQSTLDETNLKLREEESRLHSLQEALSSLSPNERTTPPDGTVAVSPLEERIQAIERKIDELSLRYTDEHPDLIGLRNALERLQIQLDQQRAQGEATKLPNNPIFQELRLKLSDVRAEIAALRARRDRFEREVEDLHEQMETLPQIEAELNALRRDYDSTKREYDELRARLAAAKMREKADRAGQNVRFTIIEPPVVPTAPTFPDRLLLSAGASMLALGAGLGLALALGQLRPVFSSVLQLQKTFAHPVTGAIAHAIPSGGPSFARRNATFLAGAAMLLAVYAIVATMFLLGAA